KEVDAEVYILITGNGTDAAAGEFALIGMTFESLVALDLGSTRCRVAVHGVLEGHKTLILKMIWCCAIIISQMAYNILRESTEFEIQETVNILLKGSLLFIYLTIYMHHLRGSIYKFYIDTTPLLDNYKKGKKIHGFPFVTVNTKEYHSECSGKDARIMRRTLVQLCILNDEQQLYLEFVP
ncbi:hypothetical protein Tco_1198151, partial [Tanacetum coccineum]